MTDDKFPEFAKIARISRDCTVTEKIDGTNGLIAIGEDESFRVGSRTRWIVPDNDNFGFAAWAYEHRDELLTLGPGNHYGEWWGSGIQRGYGLQEGEKRFSLFNTDRWGDAALRPACCGVVPTLYVGTFDTHEVDLCVSHLSTLGSHAAPGFMKPEGVIVWHHAASTYFKKTCERDTEWKGKTNALDGGVR